MRKDKELAIAMRKEGESYSKIQAKLRIPKATLSDWFSKEDWSVQMRKQLTAAANTQSSIRMKELDKVRGQQLERVYTEAREEARREFETLKYHPLFLAGIMLYWGEGTKTHASQTRLANTDPEMIRLYTHFLTKVCQIPPEKVRIAVLAYPDLDEASVKRFWSFVSGVPLAQFHKTMVIQGRHATRRVANGVCTVIVSSSYFREKMLEWLKLLPKELMKREYYEIIPQ